MTTEKSISKHASASRDLILLAKPCAEYFGIAIPSLGSIVLGDGKLISSICDAEPGDGPNFTLKSYDRMLGTFAAIWPASLDWPSGVDRPQALPLPPDRAGTIVEKLRKAEAKRIQEENEDGEAA